MHDIYHEQIIVLGMFPSLLCRISYSSLNTEVSSATADLLYQIADSGVVTLSVLQIHHSIDPSISWWLSFAAGAMVGVWIAFCLSTVTEVHVWDFVEESWIQ